MDIDNLDRPPIPDALLEVTGANLFMPAPELMSWIDMAFLDEDGPLYTEDHSHLPSGEIACLWTNAENVSKGRRIVGQAEMPKGGSKWSQARSMFQIEQWFGYEPEFLLTFDALYCMSLDNASFCALVSHELYHCAQATDRFGMPSFNEATGKPNYCIRAHEISEFIGVVRDFGVEAAGPEAVDFVLAAAQRPTFGPAKVASACGTCLRAVAA